MNIAFFTVILFIIILPGVAFHKGYYSSEFSRNYIPVSIFNFVFSGLIPAIIFHALAYFITLWFTKYKIDFSAIGILVTGKHDNGAVSQTFMNIEKYLFQIILYNIALSFFAWLSGFCFRKLVRYLHFDILFRLFRFSNRYFYLFNSEFMDVQHYDSLNYNIFKKLWLAISKRNLMEFSNEIDFTMADVLMEVGGEVYIYKGYVETFYMNKDAGIDRIILKHAIRRRIPNPAESTEQRKKKKKEKEFTEIPGKYLLIPSKNIININIDYYTWER
ncbi:MAG: hypothetical protein MI922_25100 [Bacteroidales bacterium]|nr:hypothetical protein [Bacteroidales bacterium]